MHGDRVTESPMPGAGQPGAGTEVPGAALLRLVEVMDTLRVGCPWDAKQTHESLAPYLLEECYEALEALEGGEPAALRDELGDVLLQVVFHARVAAERTDGTGFTIDDVADGIVEKLIRRHPHVFGDVQVSGAEDVKRNWDAIKAAERGGRDGALPAALGSVPFGQPALSLAAQLQPRARTAPVRAAPVRAAPVRAAPVRAAPVITGPVMTGSARSARHCSLSWPGHVRPGSTRNWNCAPRRGATGSGSGGGRRNRAATPPDARGVAGRAVACRAAGRGAGRAVARRAAGRGAGRAVARRAAGRGAGRAVVCRAAGRAVTGPGGLGANARRRGRCDGPRPLG